MKKKLKAWQIILLIVFYPAGIIYLIVRANKKKKGSSLEIAYSEPRKERKEIKPEDRIVMVTKTGKYYHCCYDCLNNSSDWADVPEFAAIKAGYQKCKKCDWAYWEEDLKYEK